MLLDLTFNSLAAINVKATLYAGGILLAIGLAFAIMLYIASKKLRIEQDPVVAAILGVLPGANCGGCGLAGCSAYAEAVAQDHGLMGRCGPGGEDLVRKIGAILGIEAAASAPLRAVVHCGARTEDKINSARYLGVQSCTEAQMIPGQQDCPYGCMGLGDCVRACEFDAIAIIDGLAKVNYSKCVGCGACVKACPRQIIELIPLKDDPTLVIACSSLDKAKEVRAYCKVGCVGCGLCAKLAPTDFQMRQNLAAIDYEKYNPRGEAFEKAVSKCPRAAMVWIGAKERTQTPIM